MKQLKEDSAVKKVICYVYLYVSIICGFVWKCDTLPICRFNGEQYQNPSILGHPIFKQTHKYHLNVSKGQQSSCFSIMFLWSGNKTKGKFDTNYLIHIHLLISFSMEVNPSIRNQPMPMWKGRVKNAGVLLRMSLLWCNNAIRYRITSYVYMYIYIHIKYVFL